MFLNFGNAKIEGTDIGPAYRSLLAGSRIVPCRPGEENRQGKKKQDGVRQDEGEVRPAAEASETAAGCINPPGQGEADQPDEADEQEGDKKGARTLEHPDYEEGAAYHLHPGKHNGDEERQSVRKDLIILDALGKLEGVGDLQGSRPDEDTAYDQPEKKEQPAAPDHGLLSSGSPAADHSDQPPLKIRTSWYPLSWMSLARAMLVWQSPPSQ